MTDTPSTSDNRKYDYTNRFMTYRDEYPIIESMIPPHSKVIDMGCGNGSLLQLLKEIKQIHDYGIEISQSGVDICEEKGLNVQQGRIDAVSDIEDKLFDYAICNVTIQMVMYPEILLSEMKRISKYQIVSFPNFGHLANRLDMLFNGRMPKPFMYGYEWYNTGHIHQLSIRDFDELISKIGFMVCRKEYLGWKSTKPMALFLPNMLATEAIYLMRGTEC